MPLMWWLAILRLKNFIYSDNIFKKIFIQESVQLFLLSSQIKQNKRL